jgi:hypothetical protein
MTVHYPLSAILNDKFVLIEGGKNIGEAYKALHETGGNNWWYLIIQNDKNYQIRLFYDLNTLALRLGPDFFRMSIRDLPSPSTELHTMDFGEVDQEQAVTIARSKPGQILGITKNRKITGLVVVAVTRSDVFGGPSAIELYGVLADLSNDARVRYEAKAPPPVCPYCARKGYQSYDVQRQVFFCQHCKKTVK